MLNNDHIPQSISTFTHKGYKYKLQTINRQRKKEQTGIAINIVAVLQSLHHVHSQTIMGAATGDVGVVKSPPACHACFMTFYVKITILHVISTHKNSGIITEKRCYLKCINMT